MSFIISEVKLGTTKEELLNRKVLEFIALNDLPKFKRSEVSKMIDWAIKTFPPDVN
jgi:hypothetical protein